MISKEYVILSEEGLHARPAKMFIKKAKQFQSAVCVAKDGQEADGKSMLSVLSLAAGHKAKITLTVSGEDEETAFQALDRFLNEEIVHL